MTVMNSVIPHDFLASELLTSFKSNDIALMLASTHEITFTSGAKATVILDDYRKTGKIELVFLTSTGKQGATHHGNGTPGQCYEWFAKLIKVYLDSNHVSIQS